MRVANNECLSKVNIGETHCKLGYKIITTKRTLIENGQSLFSL
jgi:hypothetical protein